MVLMMNDGHREVCLQLRFIKTREGPPGVGWLEVGCSQTSKYRIKCEETIFFYCVFPLTFPFHLDPYKLTDKIPPMI